MSLERYLKYFHTVRYLKVQQVFGRVTRRFKKVNTTPVAGLVLREPVKSFTPVRLSKRSMYEKGCFVFLNETGMPVDWNDPQLSKLWLYNLHYFDDLNSADAPSRYDQHKELIRKWIEENSPVFGNGWEPYPVSLRIVNWIKWFLYHGHAEQSHLSSLGLQSKVLMQT
ncbi:MAG: heparinase, partial [Oceanospirillaceae bacterium]|nr:heparinase [Oceanospirillaceae bacterium]